MQSTEDESFERELTEIGLYPSEENLDWVDNYRENLIKENEQNKRKQKEFEQNEGLTKEDDILFQEKLMKIVLEVDNYCKNRDRFMFWFTVFCVFCFFCGLFGLYI